LLARTPGAIYIPTDRSVAYIIPPFIARISA
jgi:hypothetical protein